MDASLVKADIFFFVTTIALVILTFLLVVGLLYVLSILKTIRQISKTAQVGAETVVGGIKEAKTELAREGYVPDTLVDIFKRLYKNGKKPKK